LESKIKIHHTLLPEVKLIQPQIFEDERGFFYESFNQQKFNDSLGLNINFVQDNHSLSKYGVLRGLHYQDIPFAQGKLVRVTNGKIFDVAVDIRKSSKNFGKWTSAILSAENKNQLWIPEGFAHGFLVLSDFAEMQYKTTNFYSFKHEKCIAYNDDFIGISWPKISVELNISDKDRHGRTLSNFE